MIVKIFIQSKTDAAKEDEFRVLLRELRARAAEAEGFISGETMQSVDDPTAHLTIGTWKSISNLNAWLGSDTRRVIQEKFKEVLTEPVKMAVYHYE